MSHATPRIFGYAHASSDSWDPRATIQEEMILAKAETLKGRWVHCRREEQTSVTDVPWNERPEFKKLMSELEPGDHLVIWQLDQLDRSPLGTVAALEWFFDRGVSVHVLEYGGLQVDLDAQSGRLLTKLLAEFARLLVDYRREAVRQSVRWRKERGLAYNKMPELGKRRTYKRIPLLRKPGATKRQGYDTWGPQDCDVIREIWRRHELEDETLYSIAKDLKARDVRRWDGKLWVPAGYGRRPGTKRYPFNSRTVQRAFWRYTARLAAQGHDLQDLPARPEDVQLAIRRLKEHRLRWTKKGQPGRLPQEVCNLLEQNDLDALSEITPRSWQERLYPGPGQ